MTAESFTGPVGSAPAPPGGRESAGPLPPPAERGTTLVPDRVVAKIAARAAREALEKRFDAPPGRLGLGTPKASASVRGGSARVALALDLPYPVDIARSVGVLQELINRRVTALTGLAVDEVDLTVRRLVLTDGPDRRRVR